MSVASSWNGEQLQVRAELDFGAWRRVLWSLTTPCRWYLRASPVQRGKGLVLRAGVLPFLPDATPVRVQLNGRLVLQLEARERIARRLALFGSFELPEMRELCRRIPRGGCAIDVGANVGLFTLAFADAVGDAGRVLAVEPQPACAERLRATFAANRLTNVTIVQSAVGAQAGTVVLNLTDDLAFASTSAPKHGMPVRQRIEVRQTTLDEVWRDAGRPAVAAMKLDIEGAEDQALSGARELLATCRPALLVEANGPEERAALDAHLLGLGYQARQPSGFEPWNFLFLAE